MLKFATPCRANWLNPVFTNLDIFLLLLFPIEIVLPEWTLVRVSLMISLTIKTLEYVRIRISFLCFKSRRISSFICLATLSKLVIILWFMRAITLDAFRPLYSAQESRMSPSLIIFTLRDTGISVSFSYSSNETSNIKAPIDKVLGFCSTLSIPYIDSYDSHVQFGGYFDNS